MEIVSRFRLGCCCADVARDGHVVVGVDQCGNDTHEEDPAYYPGSDSGDDVAGSQTAFSGAVPVAAFLSKDGVEPRSRDCEFAVTLYKDAGHIFGVKVMQRLSTGEIVVKSIGKGLVQEWNEMHPERRVKVGDKIVAINGVRTPSAVLLMEKLRTNAKLELVFQGTNDLFM